MGGPEVNPRWSWAVNKLGVSEEYNHVLGPPRYEIDQKGVSFMNDLVGFSCSWYLAPVFVFLLTKNSAPPERSHVGVTIFMCYVWMIVTYFSFQNDYVYTRCVTKPQVMTDGVAWYQKNEVFLVLDRFIASIGALIAVILWAHLIT